MISTDTLQTVLGLVRAFIVAAMGAAWAAMDSPDGFNFKSPVLWVTLVYAGIDGVKSYFAAGVKTELPAPVTVPK